MQQLTGDTSLLENMLEEKKSSDLVMTRNETRQVMEWDSDSFKFQPTSGKRALNGTLCNGCGAINTEVVRADILQTSEVLTEPFPA